MCGGHLVSELVTRICDAMSSLEYIESSYPMLSNWGVRDQDVMVHSLGCSVWNELGTHLGYMAVTECPAPKTHGDDIRPDSTWFNRDKRNPEVLIEFERFDGANRGQSKLDEKLSNLLEASMRWGNTPSVLILSAWSKDVTSAPNKTEFIKKARQGFKTSKGAHVPPLLNTKVLFSRFIFDLKRDGTLLLNQVRCERLL